MNWDRITLWLARGFAFTSTIMVVGFFLGVLAYMSYTSTPWVGYSFLIFFAFVAGCVLSLMRIEKG